MVGRGGGTWGAKYRSKLAKSWAWYGNARGVPRSFASMVPAIKQHGSYKWRLSLKWPILMASLIYMAHIIGICHWHGPYLWRLPLTWPMFMAFVIIMTHIINAINGTFIIINGAFVFLN